MSAKGHAGGLRGSGLSQRERGNNARALGLGATGPAGHVLGPWARQWAGAMVSCELCGLQVILAISRRRRTMRVDPYPRSGARVMLLPSEGHRPLAVVLSAQVAASRAAEGVDLFPYHGATCWAQRRLQRL